MNNWPAANAIDPKQLLALFSAGHYVQLETQLNTLIRHHPQTSFLWSLLGATLQMSGKDGLVALRKASTLSPNDPDVHGNLGAALQQRGRHDDAEMSYRRALEIRPDDVRSRINLGNLLIVGGRFEHAESFFRQALRIDPRVPEAHLSLGNVLSKMGRLDEAEDSFLRTLHYRPDSADAFFCLGNVQRERGAFDQAISSYRSALRISPGFAPAFNNLGNVHLDLGSHAEALECFCHALRLDPAYAEAHANLALICMETGRLTDAEASLREALKITPNRPDLHGKLGYVLKEMGRVADAALAYGRQLEFDPGSAEAKIALAILELPAAPLDADESRQAPDNFRGALENLSHWLDADPVRLAALSKAIGLQQPFLLAYRDGNHVDLLSRYGDLAAKCFPPDPIAQCASGGKIRLLVISNQVRRHSVWDVVLRGLLVNLDRSRLDLIVYHTGNQEDDETRFARSIVDSWRDRRQFPHFENLLAAIKADRPDAILYPEIGMDPFSFRLAAHRLAPLQMASWGHPISTGLETIDVFLSGQLLESDNAQAHYRERLVRLPGTGCCTSALDIAPEPLDEIGDVVHRQRGTLFVIAQRAFKFDPLYDGLYADIAAAVGECSFILLEDPVYPWATKRVVSRLIRTFQSRGLDAQKHLIEIPWLSSGKFVSLLDATDVFLDCPAFSGYTTAWQAVHRGLPIVTLEGAYLRQRLAAGLLRKIERPETIAHSAEEYVAIAVRLASVCTDQAQRLALRQAIKDCAAKTDSDVTVVRAFERLIITELEQRLPAGH